MDELEKAIKALNAAMAKMELITVVEAAGIRGVSRSAILQLISRDRLKAYSVLGTTYVRKSDIREFQRLKTGPSASDNAILSTIDSVS